MLMPTQMRKSWAAAGDSGSGIPCTHPNISVQIGSARGTAPSLPVGQASGALGKCGSTHPYFPRAMAHCSPFVSLFSQSTPFGFEILLRARFWYPALLPFVDTTLPGTPWRLPSALATWATQGPGPDSTNSLEGGPESRMLTHCDNNK